MESLICRQDPLSPDFSQTVYLMESGNVVFFMRTEGKRDVYYCTLPLFISVCNYHQHPNELSCVLALVGLGT